MLLTVFFSDPSMFSLIDVDVSAGLGELLGVLGVADGQPGGNPVFWLALLPDP